MKKLLYYLFSNGNISYVMREYEAHVSHARCSAFRYNGS